MPTATAQVMNDSLMEIEHTPPVHKRILDILPGVSGGVARIMVGQPFDTIKTRLQVLGKGTIGAQGMPPEMVYTNGMDCVRKMVSNPRLQQQRRKRPDCSVATCIKDLMCFLEYTSPCASAQLLCAVSWISCRGQPGLQLLMHPSLL
eukprot:GHUV01018413.1.p1 GENE.GHUV01018413.1~~GHUV01018413.1.p1  ORF type:complete len:147 (-),score=31.33 GHUV01018413.1:2-442(-)